VNNSNRLQQQYKSIIEKYESKRPILFNCLRAFISGRIVCILGQIFYIYFS